MHRMNMKRPDLNLLVVLDAIARSGSVTGAAQLLALSQPAVSHALNRLRSLIGDPIYVRGTGGLVATPRGQSLIERAHTLISAACDAFGPVDFVPTTTERAFRLGTSDYASLTLVPHFYSAFRDAAPHARLENVTAGPDTLNELERGDLDCSYWGTDLPGYPFDHCELFRERHVMVVGTHNKLAQCDSIGLNDYVSQPHVVISLRDPGRSWVEVALAQHRIARRIGLVSHGFAATIAALKRNDLIATLPERLVVQARDSLLRTFPLPFEMHEHSYFLIWHRRTHIDEGSRWFRDLIKTSTMRFGDDCALPKSA